MGIVQQHPNKFNLYDVFANFLPGAVFFIGLLFPYVGIDALFTGLNAGGLLLILVLSFTAGLFVQAIGGNVQSSGRDFANHIQNVDRYTNTDDDYEETKQDPDINISTLDAYFVEAFRAELELASDFEDWNRLHKLILAKLEATSRTRALRLQALFLAMRGMAVTMALLSLWFIFYMILAATDTFPTAIPIWTLPSLSFVCFAVAGILHERGGEFSRDVAKYMIIEYCLEAISNQDRTVELDFLDREESETGSTDGRLESEVSPEKQDKTTKEQFERAKTQLASKGEERLSDENDDTGDAETSNP